MTSNVYIIEWERVVTKDWPEYGHSSYAAPSADAAMKEFQKDHPGCDVRELRRVVR